MKIFVHMQGALLLNQFVEEIDQNLIDDEEIPFSTIYLKLENRCGENTIEASNTIINNSLTQLHHYKEY